VVALDAVADSQFRGGRDLLYVSASPGGLKDITRLRLCICG